MGKTEKLPHATDTRADRQKRLLRWIQMRRRIIGALVVAATVAIVLQLGDIKRPPVIHTPAPPDSGIAKPQISPDLQDARRRLQQTPEIAIPNNSKPNTPQPISDGDASDATAQSDSDAAQASDSEVNAPNAIQAEQLSETAARFANEDAGNSSNKPTSPNSESETAAFATSAANPLRKGKFVVQVGAFSEIARAEEVAAFLREQKYPVILEPISLNNKTFTRVRVGTYPSREVAERTRQKIIKLGYPEARINDLR